MIRVVLADDHHLVRQGIRALLEKDADIEVVGEAADGQEALELVERLNPDVLVMDISMPRLNGTQALEKVRSLGLATRVLILSMHSDEPLVQQALQTGARGYLLKRAVTDELLLAVRAVSRGDLYLSPAISGVIVDGYLMGGASLRAAEPFDRLSPREREVLQLVAEGRTNNQIAHLLKISVKTVEKHRTSLMAKLRVHDVTALIRLAIKHGLIFLDG